MKRFEDFTKDDLWQLRKEVLIGSIFYDDYNNSLGIDCHSASDFFDGWLDFVREDMKEDIEDYDERKFFKYLKDYDNAESLERWFLCFEDFSWVKYVQ